MDRWEFHGAGWRGWGGWSSRAQWRCQRAVRVLANIRVLPRKSRASRIPRFMGPTNPSMDLKTRLVLPLLMSGIMVLMVTLVVTYLNLGIQADFIERWMRAYFIAWPIAAATGFVALPWVRRATERIVSILDRGRRGG